jgi:serine/threonine protein kinase
MVVEYVPGGTLNDRQKAGERFRHEDSVRLLEGIGSALDYAHGLGIVHRDVKPANVLLDASGSPVLADFGLAKLLSQSSLKTASGVTTGTPAYMSPEQAAGEDLDPRSDVYSVGCLGYFLLTGQSPFAGRPAGRMLAAHVYEPPAPLTGRRPDVPEELQAVVLRCLAKEPARRFASAECLDGALAASPAAGRWDEAEAADWWRANRA